MSEHGLEQNFTEIRRINKLLKQGNISAIDDTAMLRYYSMLLAYSMAVLFRGVTPPPGPFLTKTYSELLMVRPGRSRIKREAFEPRKILTVTANVRAEFGERAAIAELYASKSDQNEGRSLLQYNV